MKLSGLKVLIVDDDHFFREILQKCIETEGARAMGVESVEQAKKAIPMFSPSVLLTDVQMPGGTGVDLLKWVVANHPAIPVVVMTGFSELLDASTAANAGAVGFLPKPFKEDELSKTLLEAIAVHKGKENKDKASSSTQSPSSETSFLKVSVEDFITGSQITVPIFVKVPSAKGERYVKVAHGGEDLSPDRIAAYRSKGLKHFYLSREDYLQYVGLNVKITKMASNSGISLEKRAYLVRHTMELVQQQFFESDISEAMLDHASTLVEVGVSVLTENEGGFFALDAIKSISDELYAHSTAVSMVSCMIGKSLGWTSPKTLSTVSIGGMLHDTGKRQLPVEIITKPRTKMTPAEIALYETHPQRAMEMLSDLDFVPSEVIQAVHQHHERTNGTGFPNHLMSAKIFPLAKVIAVADEFCHLYIKSKDLDKHDPSGALNKLVTMYSDGLDPEMIIALHHAFKMPVPETLQKRMKKLA